MWMEHLQLMFPEHSRSEQDLLQWCASQGASHGGETYLKTEELLPVSFLPLGNVVGRGNVGRAIRAMWAFV